MKLEKLIQNLPGMIRCIGDQNVDVDSLCMDSRKAAPGAMFFCIPGLTRDAHDFAPQAVGKGASALVVERELPLDCPQVLVRDAREAVSYIAATFYGHPAKELTLIGITGTKGKTTTSFLVKSILEQMDFRVGLIGTVGSMIGDRQIPSTLTTPDPVDFQKLLRDMADAGCTHVVMEVSAHALALKKLVGVKFAVAGFTNLSQDHFDFFHDMEHYQQTKMLLFTPEFTDKMVINADDERVREGFEAAGLNPVLTGISYPSDFYAKDIEVNERGSSFRIGYHKQFRMDIALQLSGIFNVYNSLMAAALCRQVGATPEAIERGLEAVRFVPGRIELLETDTPYRVILDYAHSPDSLENILNAVRGTTRKRMIALFGCGGDRDREKRPIMGEIGGRLADFCILTSDNPRGEDPMAILAQIEAGIRGTRCEYIVIENRREAIRYALCHALPGDVIVLAGKGHETYQEIAGVKHPFDEKIVVRELLSEIHESAALNEAGR
ncbi:MAG: UDP-N-acetylmuramoyl-L-alanyl-D-glutamate--2,6-diaminopimelate ligase [Clostridia bacterium]|nr:UDP-N-acetylmuramoyl-L-alanyl-D-glutamate--2,6-diaminopimelate ligase [Clostridia bacterium]